ncbi:MAG: chromosome segregation protein SMC [Candidatus Woesearchaeota archaeon]
MMMNSNARITRLVAQGFKSFAKKTEMEFSDGFNTILGPNGSGKSNVLDAICFVLGKSGAKGLRAEKTANLIYNGGKRKQPSNKAEVSIFFDNKTKIFPVDSNELKITRTLSKDGTSQYRINDKKHTRQQVVDMLGAARINPDGYNIILQGDIVSFVEQSGNDRRLLVEEIAGIDIYEDKKQKTLNELRKVEEKLKEAQILITERETHLRELKRDRDQALKYRQLEENIHSYRATLLTRKHEGIMKEKSSLDERKKGIEDRISKHNEQLSSYKNIILQLRGRIDEITREIEEKGEKEQVSLQREVENLKVELARDESRRTVLEQEISRINVRKKQLDEEAKTIDSKVSEVKNSIDKLSDERTAKIAESSQIERMITDFKKKHKLKDDAEEEEKLENIEKESEKIQSEIIVIKEKEQALLRDKDRLEFQIDNIRRQQEKVGEIEKEHKKEILKIRQMKEEFKKTVKEIEKLLVEDARIAQESSQLRRRLVEFNDEKSKLEAQLSAARMKSSSSKAVDTILNEKKRIKGIHAPVADLINVSRQNSLAVEVCGGGRMNAIVVENEDTAKKCIELLRLKKVGTATFLPLNKIKPPDTKTQAVKHKGKDGVIGLVREIAKYDAKYNNIMKYVFSDTLIVRDLDIAKKLGIGSARFVTLDGDIADMSGSMTGGFRGKRESRVSIANLSEKIGDLEEQIKSISDMIMSTDKKRAEHEEMLNARKVYKSELEGDIIKGEKTLHLASSDLDIDNVKEKELNKSLKDVNESLKKLSQESYALTRRITDLKVERQKIRSTLSESRNPRILAELSAFEQKHRDLRERIISIDAQVKESRTRSTELYNVEKDKIAKIIKQITSEETDFVKELEKINVKISKDTSLLQKKEQAASAFYEEFKELFKQRNDIQDEMRKKENDRDNTDIKIREEEMKLNNLSLRLAEVNAQIASLGEELESFNNARILSEDEVSTPEIQSKIRAFERLIEDLGNVNLKALDMYEQVESQYKELLSKRASLEKEMESVMKLIDEIEEKKKELFMQTFEVVNQHFKNFFSQLSAKGSAYLQLENSDDPFAGGLYIKVNIQGSKYMDIRGLSGGEKTMTALAFIFAIQEHEPAPFYVLDEVDAALDKKNSDKFGEMIRAYCKRAQYIVISHNDVVISKADVLYGVSMDQDGMSNVVSLKL